jgi:hypothetical protein
MEEKFGDCATWRSPARYRNGQNVTQAPHFTLRKYVEARSQLQLNVLEIYELMKKLCSDLLYLKLS